MSAAGDTTSQSVQFILPDGVPAGTYLLTVTANGITSNPALLQHHRGRADGASAEPGRDRRLAVHLHVRLLRLRLLRHYYYQPFNFNYSNSASEQLQPVQLRVLLQLESTPTRTATPTWDSSSVTTATRASRRPRTPTPTPSTNGNYAYYAYQRIHRLSLLHPGDRVAGDVRLQLGRLRGHFRRELVRLCQRLRAGAEQLHRRLLLRVRQRDRENGGGPYTFYGAGSFVIDLPAGSYTLYGDSYVYAEATRNDAALASAYNGVALANVTPVSGPGGSPTPRRRAGRGRCRRGRAVRPPRRPPRGSCQRAPACSRRGAGSTPRTRRRGASAWLSSRPPGPPAPPRLRRVRTPSSLPWAPAVTRICSRAT